MQKDKLTHVSLISRVLLGFLFIYHGLVPKILWLSAVEVHLVSTSGLGVPAKIASPLVGIVEIVLGCAIIFLNKSNIPVYIAVAILLLLLLSVAVASPMYSIGAFNPITTNILGLGFCYLILFVDKA
ncbi:DoxX family protein [Psychrobacter sp. N25K4-3-2]|uniref:DoxX-like family protein n=1 Tax=Psychrobacter sp. N25K4-3-2 TaxID=2785026 RepID=UPI00188CBD1A|nr:DoxX-like family protein [Psychrobacter sp. N25K4-3-2]MBF4489810.1 DoxX family protein [Psychrobacter sp. N25K4-3-2]